MRVAERFLPVDAVEDLREHEVFRFQLMDGIVNMANVERLARIIGRIHFATHVTTIGKRRLDELDRNYAYVKAEPALT